MDANQKMLVETGQALGGKRMAATKFPNVNGMGVRPLEGSFNSARPEGDARRGRIGEPEAGTVVARGEFGGTRAPEGKVRMEKGRRMRRREGRR